MGETYRFGNYTLNEDTRQLLLDGSEVHLSPKAFDLLSFLIANRARAIAKAELQERVWPGTFIEETNLAGLVADLRRALRDSAADPKFVRTVFGFGYRFVADVASVAQPPRADKHVLRCWLMFLDREVPLLEGANTIGRGADTAIRIDSPGLSRRHARIVVSAGQGTLEDLGSKNGTYVNGRRIDTRSPLADGDEIRFGAVQATFRVATAMGPTETLTSGGA